jgi:hypothetical protein
LVAQPSLTLTITPPAGSPATYQQYLAWSGANGQMTITQNFGRQGDTALFPLIDDWQGRTTPHFYIETLSQISLYDNVAGQNLFAGVVTDPALLVSAAQLNEWDLACTDYTYYADNAIAQGTFNGYSVDEIVVALTEKADCGITAATVANGGYVAPGPVLAAFTQNFDSLSNAWRNLASLASSVTPYGWYVDADRNLHFYDATTAISSGVTFTTTPTSSGAGSLTEGHFSEDSQFTYEWDASTMHNRILVQGANQTIPYGTNPTDTWLGNGALTSWPLRYTVSGTPTLTVGGASQTVTVVSAGDTGSGEWQVQQNANGAYFLVNTVAAPAAGVLIKAWYNYQVPVVAQVNDYSSQAEFTGPNGGVFAEYISDSSLTTTSMALATAMSERQEFAYPAERITFNTTQEWLGWARAGETCRIINSFVPDSQNSYAWGLSDTFLITALTATFGGTDAYRISQITAVRI